MLVLLIVLVCVAGVSAVPTHPQRIGGGSNTTINQYPSVVALLYSANMISYWHTCAGTILNDYSILTAAHCIDGDAANKWGIRAGSTYANSGGVVYNIGTVIIHPGFNSRTLVDDVAILRSATTIVFNNVTKPGFIAESNYDLGDNEVVRAVGWGTTSFGGPTSETLRHVQIWVVNQDVCRARYATLGWPVTDNMLCSGWLGVGGRDQCQGDSGGPVVHNNVVVGVCSFGQGCALPFYPGVNTRVSSYTSWIQSNA